VFATEQNRPDIARRRTWWKRHQHKIDPARLVFIDETWAKTNMARTHGWWQRGVPLRTQVPHGHWRTMTFLAALQHDRIAAPCVIDGPINGESFRALCRADAGADTATRRYRRYGQSRLPQGSAIRRAIRAVDARLVLLPPYSPDLNPFEQVFRKAKNPAPDGQGAHHRRRLAAQSALCSSTSHHRNAPTICTTQAMLQSKSERL
jgi:transposase